jgi:hypothetical protein
VSKHEEEVPFFSSGWVRRHDERLGPLRPAAPAIGAAFPGIFPLALGVEFRARRAAKCAKQLREERSQHRRHRDKSTSHEEHSSSSGSPGLLTTHGIQVPLLRGERCQQDAQGRIAPGGTLRRHQ